MIGYTSKRCTFDTQYFNYFDRRRYGWQGWLVGASSKKNWKELPYNGKCIVLSCFVINAAFSNICPHFVMMILPLCNKLSTPIFISSCPIL